jgi:hypothetical protein
MSDVTRILNAIDSGDPQAAEPEIGFMYQGGGLERLAGAGWAYARA